MVNYGLWLNPDLWFLKVFMYVVFNFWNPNKSLTYTRHQLPYLVFLNLEFYLHLVDENSLLSQIPYTDLVFTLILRTIIFPTLLYGCYCSFNVSLYIIIWLTNDPYTWVFSELEELVGRSHSKLHVVYHCGGCVNTHALHIVCRVCVYLC
jgi:hypothetical protein